jgi:lipopolysaccharide biosynthesis glycosyltransferase
MENKICAITEASDKYFHFTRTSIYSFIENNKWFDGTIYLLTHNSLPISSKNLMALSSIYPKLEVIETRSLLKKYSELFKNDRTGEILNSVLKLAVFDLNFSKTLYFSNTCLFTKPVFSLLNPGKLTFPEETLNIFYLDCKINFYEDYYISNSPLTFESLKTNPNYFISNFSIINSSKIKDNKYNQLKNLFELTCCIIYDTFSQSVKDYSKINNIWLHKNKISTEHTNKPTNVNIPRHNLTNGLLPPKFKNSLVTLKYFSGEYISSNVALCTICNDSFVLGTKVLLFSFLEKNKWFKGDIIVFYSENYSSLSNESMQILNKIYPKIIYKKIDESDYSALIEKFKTLPGSNLRFVPSFFTFDAFDLVETYENVVYLDSDMIVLDDLSELFSLDIGIAVTPDAGEYDISKKYQRFNGGFLVLGNSIRGKNYKNKLISQGMNLYKMQHADQTILNDVLKNNIYYLNSRYNCLKRCFPDNKFKEFDKSIKIIHYVGAKPWNKNKVGMELNYSKIENIWHLLYTKIKKI